jgi:hypothetical protein
MPEWSKIGINTHLIFQDELERELEELEQEELDKELLGVGASVDELSSVPTTEIAKPVPSKTKPSVYYRITWDQLT